MNSPIRLVVVEPNGSGGLVHYAYQLCSALSDEGLRVTLITGAVYELKDFPHNFQVSNILNLWNLFDPKSMEDPPRNFIFRLLRKIHWTFRRGLRAYKLIREWFLLTNYLIQLQPDLIQFGKINFPFEAIFLKRLRNHGLTLTQICHEFERRENNGAFSTMIDRMYKSVYTNFSCIFFHAKENRDRFISVYPSYPTHKTSIIPHGNEEFFLSIENDSICSDDVRQGYGIPKEVPVVLFFGILSPSKGIDVLIEAFSFVREECDSRLLIAGYPTKYMNIQQLKHLIKEQKLEDSIILDTRYIPSEEVGALMKLASVVVYPYISSTQSGALQVAYSFGRPVIATNVGGLPEVVEDGLSGYLVPPQEPLTLSKKIIDVICNHNLAIQMGMYAKQLSETKYSWPPIARRISSVYKDLQ